MTYQPAENRYQSMTYNRCGKSGLHLPAISLGLWHNFGHGADFANAKQMVFRAFDLGVTHFDLANNYGPPPGSAEENFGKILQQEMRAYRDEMIISSKAGYLMWPGPYGEWGSRKYLMASIDQSLQRMGLDYVDIFYSHRFDPNTPLAETMGALAAIVRQGKALYAGISSYKPEVTTQALKILQKLGTPCLIHQPKYSMFERSPENGLLDVLGNAGVGCIVFSPLAQGLLSDKYLNGIPANSRAGKPAGFLRPAHITPAKLKKIAGLHALAKKRAQSLPQMALAWLLKDKRVTSVVAGASTAAQIEENVAGLKNVAFSADELTAIENALN